MIALGRREVSVRGEEAGGPVRPFSQGPCQWSARNGPIVLLVHGFNNTLDDARDAYARFIKRLAPLVQEPLTDIGGPLCGPDEVYRFYWPGDTDLWLLSFVSYPCEIEPAEKSGAELARFITEVYHARPLSGLLDIHAHSLGGRVVLEALTALARASEVPRGFVRRVSMTAAAVLVEDVDPDAPASLSPRQRLLPGAQFAGEMTIITSEEDVVLMLGFPLGEAIAEGGTGRALGRYGPPPGLRARHEAVKVGHTGYWDCPPDVAQAVIEALKLTRIRRDLPSRPIAARETAPSREIASRSIAGIQAP